MRVRASQSCDTQQAFSVVASVDYQGAKYLFAQVLIN